MSIKLIAVGTNGTFLSDTKTYNRSRFFTQYQRIRRRDIRLMVTSGNQYYQLISLLSEITHQIAFVAGNGGQVVGSDKNIFNYQLPLHHSNAMVDRLQTLPNIEIVACGKRNAYALNRYNDTLEAVAAEYYHRLELVDDSSHLDDMILRFGLNVPGSLIPEVQPKLHAALGDTVTTVATGYGSIDLIMPGMHKTNGLRILQQRWGIEDHEVVTFGNSGNDIEILQHAGFGFAMTNARKDVRAVTSRHAPHDNEEGVLWIIDKVLNRGTSFA